jgi:hypothetical protein
MSKDRLDEPLEERYEDGMPDVAPVDHEAFEPHEDWGNYWDVNPVDHGGTFIRWDDHHWKIVEVWPPSVWPEDEYIVEQIHVHPDDVWQDPDDPATDFTEDMKKILRSLSDEHHLPVAPPFLESVTYYVADFTHYIRDHYSETFEIPESDEDAYWEQVEQYGVERSDIE